MIRTSADPAASVAAIAPEPSPEEAAAIASAVAVLLAQAVELVPDAAPVVSRWRRVARQEAVGGWAVTTAFADGTGSDTRFP